MVTGLDRFRDHFAGYEAHYALIGGVACDVIFDDAGLPFRATKDLDIVLMLETLDTPFIEMFWAFVQDGGYTYKGQGKPRFYRFQKPKQGYPAMLELFARQPDILTVPKGTHLTPIPTDENVSSLSAILLDDTYYAWIQQGKQIRNGLSIVGPEHLIPLKAKAWLDLSRRRAQGEAVDSRAIRKHRNDVFRLFQVIDPMYTFGQVPSIGEDMARFITAMREIAVDMKALGIDGISKDQLLDELQDRYDIR